MRSYMLQRSAASAAAAVLSIWTGAAQAGQASVLDVVVRANQDGTYGFDVTVSHADEGWSHYVDRWEILGPDGKVLAARELYHPHVDEQPFMRSLGRVEVPIGVTRVTVRAHDSKHGNGKRTATVDLPPRK